MEILAAEVITLHFYDNCQGFRIPLIREQILKNKTMKKKFILFSLVGGLCYAVLSGNASGPGTASGHNGTTTATCSGGSCHTTTTGATIVTSVQLLDATMSGTTTYTPGGSYTIRVSALNTSTSSTVILPRFGFQVSATKISTIANAGTLTAPSGAHAVTLSGMNIIEHSSATAAFSGTGGGGTIYQKDIPWTAPIAGTGSVLLKGIINAVNNNGATNGDTWDYEVVTITEATSSGVSPITGTLSVCVGATTTLADATAGGTWSSSATSVATISSSGVVTGITAGTTTISYIASAGTATAVVTVNPNPADITGIPVVCPGGVTTLADATPGGTWSSSSAATATVGASTGVVTGVAAGAAIITYALSTGCRDTAALTVSPVPPIAGTGTVCVGATTTLTHAAPGGSWSSSSTATATVGATSGVVTGVTAGTATISYTFGTSGCYATTVVTVSGGAPVITGPATVCATHTITLASVSTGGTWSSSATAKATVGATSGVVTGVATGTATIKYKVTGSCGTDSATRVITVTPATPCVTGIMPVVFADELKLFPNPNSGAFSLNVLSLTDEQAHVVITNILGGKVSEFTIETNTLKEINIGQPAGIYFISASTEHKKYFVKMVVE